MNRLPDTGHGHGYGRTPEDRFPLPPSQQRPDEGFSRFAQGGRLGRRDPLSSGDGLLGRGPRGYGSGQWDVPVNRPLVPEQQIASQAAEALLGQLLQIQANTLPSRDLECGRREGHQYSSNFRNQSGDTWPSQRDRYNPDPSYRHDNYSDLGRDTFNRSDGPYGITGSGNAPRPAPLPMYRDTRPPSNPPADFYRSTDSRQETYRGESFAPRHQSVQYPYDRTRLEPRDRPYSSGPEPRDRPYSSGPEPRDRPYSSGPEPRDRPYSSGPEPRDRPYSSGPEPRDGPYSSGPEPRDGPYSSGYSSQISNNHPLRSSNSSLSYPSNVRAEEYRAGPYYTGSGGSYGSHSEKAFPPRRSPPLSEPIRGGTKQLGSSHRDSTGRTDHIPVRSRSPGSSGNYSGSRRTASSRDSTNERGTQSRQPSYKETTTSFEKRPIEDRLDPAVRDPPSVNLGEGKIGDRYKPYAVESRLGPVPDDPSRSSIQSRLGPSLLQPVSSIQDRLGPQIGQSCALPVPSEHSSHTQLSPAVFMPAETHVTASSEPLSDLRLKLREQRKGSVDRDLKSSSSSPAQSLPLPGHAGSLSPVISVRKPLAPLPLTAESKDPSSVLSPSGGKKQGLKSPPLQSHSLHKQHSHGSSKSRSATPTLTPPEGTKVIPSENRKLKPITIRRPKTSTGSTLVQKAPVVAKKPTSPKRKSVPPGTEPSKALATSVSDRKKTTPTEDHESKKIKSELPGGPLPTGMSTKPGMDAVIKPAISSVIKPSTLASNPPPSSRPIEVHVTALSSNPSGGTVNPAPTSKTQTRHKTGNLPNPFSKLHTSRVTTLKDTPSSANARKTPKSPSQERRRSSSSGTLSSAELKRSAAHQKSTLRKHTPVAQPKLPPPSRKEVTKVAKPSAEPVKLVEAVHSCNIAERVMKAAAEAVPGSTGAKDVLKPTDQKWGQTSPPVNIIPLSSSDTHAPPTLLPDVLPFSGFNEIPQPNLPPHPPLQSPPIKHEPPSVESVPGQLNPPPAEHSSMYSQPNLPQSYPVHVKEDLVEDLDSREEGELDMSDDSDVGLVIDENASETDDPCSETKYSDMEAAQSNAATADNCMEVQPTANHMGIKPLTDHTEVPLDHSRAPPVAAQMGTVGSSASHPSIIPSHSSTLPSQSPSAQLGSTNLVHNQPQSSLHVPSADHLPQSNPRKLPRRIEKTAISAIGNHLVTVLSYNPSLDRKSLPLLHKLYYCCVRLFGYRGRTHSAKVNAYIQRTFRGFAFARDIGPSWNPMKPADIFVSELKHLHQLCGDNVRKWSELVDRFGVAARTLQRESQNLKKIMKTASKRASKKRGKVPVLASGKSQSQQLCDPRLQSRSKKATSTFGAGASAGSSVPPATPITAPYHFGAPPSHYPQPGLGPLAEAVTDPPLHMKLGQHEAVDGTWFEDRSENWTNAANEPPSANVLLSPSTETAVTSVEGPTMEHAVPLMGTQPDMEQYPPSLLPSSRTDLDMNLEPVEMDLDTSSQDLEQPGDEMVPPADAEFSSQQIDQLQNVVGQLLELEAHVQRTVERLTPLTNDYGHSSVLVTSHVQRTVERLNPLTNDYRHSSVLVTSPPFESPPFESTQFLPTVPPLDLQEVELHRQDFLHTQPVCDSPSYEEYPPLSTPSDHTLSLPPSVPPAENVRSGVMVEPGKNSSEDANVDIVDQLLPSLDVPGSSKAIPGGGEPSETTSADRSIQPIPEPHTPLPGSHSNVPRVSVSSSQEISAIQSSVKSLTRDVSLSPGEITPSPEPPPIPPSAAESKISGNQGTEKLRSFANFSAEERLSALSHEPYHAHTLSSPLKNMSSTGLASASQVRSGRSGYGRRHHYRSRSRSPSPRRRHHQRSHSRTPSPRRSLKSYRGRASRSPSPSRYHHHSSSTTGSRSSYRSHYSGSTAGGGRRVESPVTRRRYRRSSRSRSRSLSPTRGRRSRRSRSYSPSQRTRKYSRSQSTSPSRGRRSRLSRSPVHSTERRRGHNSLARSRSGRRRSRTGSRSLSPRVVPTESESEEDIELLRLKREAIMSMIKNEDAVKVPDIGGSEQKASCGEGVNLKSSNSAVQDFTKSIADVPTTSSVSAGEVHKGDKVDETMKKAVEEEEIGKAEKTAIEGKKPDTAVAKVDANMNKDTSTGQALSVCTKTRTEVRVDSAESKSAGGSHSRPQEPAKPVEPAQRSLSQPVLRPAEAADSVLLAVQTVIRSRSSSRRSSPAHRTGSQTGSPALSPPPSSSSALGQKTRGVLSANKGAQTQKPASSAKVCPGKEDTWKILPFCIKSGSADSATSDSDSESDVDVETIGPVITAPELQSTLVSMELDINKMLMEARQAAEAKVRSPPSQLHPIPPASLPSSRKKLESTSSSEGLELPSPPASLRPEQKEEYLELQKRLALHKKRKRKEMKLTREKVTEEKGEASSHPGRPSRQKPKARSTTPSGPPSKRPRISRPSLKKAAVISAAVVRERKKKMEECGTRITERELVIRSTRSQLEGEQKELTSLTNRLTECESEIEEHELKIELLNKQLKIARENHDQAEKKRSKLQDKVRSTKEKISRHNCSIQEAERSLSGEKEALQRLQSGASTPATPCASSGDEQCLSSAPSESDLPLSQSSVILFASSEKLLSVESGKEGSWSRRKVASSGEGGVSIRVTHETGAADTTSEQSVKDVSNIAAMVAEPGVQRSSGHLSGGGSIRKSVLTEPGEQGGHSPVLLDVTHEYEVISDSETGDQADSLAAPAMSLEPVSDVEEEPGTMLSSFQTETVSDPENLELESETAPPTVLRRVSLQVPGGAAIENVSDAEDVMDTTASKSPRERLIENVSEDEGDLPVVVQSGPLVTGLQIQTSSGSAFTKVSELQGSGLVQHEIIQSHHSPVEVEAISDDDAELVDTSSNRTSQVSHEHLPSAVMSPLMQENSDNAVAQPAASTEPLLGDNIDQCWPSFLASGSLGLQISKVESLSASESAWFATSPSPVAETTPEVQPHLLGSEKDDVHLQVVEENVGQKEVTGDTGKTPAITSQQLSIVQREHSYCYRPELLEILLKPPGEDERSREGTEDKCSKSPGEWTEDKRSKSPGEGTEEKRSKPPGEGTEDKRSNPPGEYTNDNEDKRPKEYTEEDEGKEAHSPAKYSSAESTSRSTTPSDIAPSASSKLSPVCPTKLDSILENLVRRPQGRKEKGEKLSSPKLENRSSKKKLSSKSKRKNDSPKRLKLQIPKCSVPSGVVSSLSSPANPRVESTLNEALHSALSPSLTTLISPDNLPRIMNLIHETSSPLQTQPINTPRQRNSLPFERAVLARLTQSVADRFASASTSEPDPASSTSPLQVSPIVSNPVSPTVPSLRIGDFLDTSALKTTTCSSASPLQVSPIVSNLVSQTVHSLSLGDFLAMAALKSTLHSVQLADTKTSCDSAQTQQQPSLGKIPALQSCPQQSSDSSSLVSATPASVVSPVTPASVIFQPSVIPASVVSHPSPITPASVVSQLSLLTPASAQPSLLTPASVVSQPSLTPVSVVSQPSPASVVSQPSPASVVSQPSPASVVSQPSPASVVSQPSPASVVSQPSPASVVSQPSPASVVSQPSPVSVVPQPSLAPASVGLQPQTSQASSTPHLVTAFSSVSNADLQMSVAAPIKPSASTPASTIPFPSRSVFPNKLTATSSIPIQAAAIRSINTSARLEDTATPSADTATPSADTATPSVDTATPSADTVTPSTENATPSADTATPSADTATPSLDTATPSLDTATPSLDTATSSVDTATPSADTVTPSTENATPSADTATPSADTATPSVDIVDQSVGASTPTIGSSTCVAHTTAHSATQSVARSTASTAVASGMPASAGATTPASNPPSQSSSTSLSPSIFTTSQYSVSLPVTFSTSFTALSNTPPVFAIPRIVSEFPLEVSPQAIDLSALKFLIEERRPKPQPVSAPTPASSGSTFSSRARMSSSQDNKGGTGAVMASSTPVENARSSNHQVMATMVQPPYIPAVVPPPTTTAVMLPKPVKPVSGLSGPNQSMLSGVSMLKSTVPNLKTSPGVQPAVQIPLPQVLPPALRAVVLARIAQSKLQPNQLPPAVQQASSRISSANNAGRPWAHSSAGISTQSQRANDTGIKNQNQAQMTPTPNTPSLRTLALASAVVKALSAVSSSTSIATTSTNFVPGTSSSGIRLLPGESGGQSSKLQVPPNSKLKGQILNLQKDLAQLKGQLAAKTALTAVFMATTSVQLQAGSQQATQSATAAAVCTSSTFLRRPIPSSSASAPPPVKESDKSLVVSDAILSGAIVRTSKSDPLPSSSSKPATGESVESVQELNIRAALKVFGIEKSREQLNQLYSSICTPNPAVNVHEILEKGLPLSNLSPPVLNTPLPTLTIPEGVVSAVENLERQTGGTSSSKGGEFPSKDSYRPYSSPLLMLQSYRLSPLYRTQAKLPLSSLTYSNKINPQKIMCKFELLGVCNDRKCIYQHIRDVRLSKEELVQDLVSYQPTLAGCTAADLSVVDETRPELQETISGKVSEYARNLMQTFGGKIKDEELFALTTHKVNQERDKLDPKNTRKSFVPVEERYWIQERGGASKSVGQRRAGEGLPLVGANKEGEGEDVVPLGGRHPPNTSSHVKRYFATGESKSAEERVRSDPKDAAAFVELAQRAVGREKALWYLELGLEANSTSEELWVEFLRVKSRDLSTRDTPTTSVSEGQTSATTSGEEWNRLCARAAVSSSSYSVTFECVQLAQTYDAKRKWTQEALKSCLSRSTPPTPTSSHQCLELLLNSVLLDLLSGRGDVAMTAMNSALFSREQPSPYSGLLSQLTQEDKVVACLSHICLVLSNTLPHMLFESPDCTPPTRVIRKETVAIPWSEAVSLSQQQREKIRKLFESSIDLCSSDESSTPTPHTLLQLHENFILFEFTQNQEKAITMLENLLTATPTADKLWLLYIRLDERRGGSGLGVAARALKTCPRTAELYHLAARAELSQASVDAPERLAKAIQWLEQCVRQFYQIPPQAELDHSETLLLYRKLLGQLVPYTYQPPAFAEGVEPKQLGSQNLVHLWMCYCLLVELTLTSVHGDFHPTSVTDAFESALLSVREKEGVRVLWREYLTYLRSQAVDEGVQGFKGFSDCVHRCLVAVDTSCPHPHTLYGQPSHYKDYSFHNEVMDMMCSCLSRTSGYALAMMQKFTQILPRNPVLIARLVKCALDQTPEQVEVAQSSMASFLADNPRCLLLWQMAIAVELRLNHVREARWMYRQAVKALPFHALLWKELLLFELRELANSHVRHSTAPLSALAAMVQHIGIDLRSLLNS